MSHPDQQHPVSPAPNPWDPRGPYPPPAPPSPAPPKPTSNAPLIVGIIAATLVVLCLGCGGLLTYGNLGNTGTGASSGTDSDTTSGDADSAADKPKVAKKGEAVRDGEFEFTVTEVKTGVANVGGQYGEDAQGAYTLVTVKVKNIGKEAAMFTGGNQVAYDAEDRKYEHDTAAGLYTDSDVFLEDINPGNTVTGVLVFDVPKGTKLTRLELHDSPYSGGVSVRL